MLPRIQPINPTRIAQPFDHLDWVFELKHDGFRALAYVEGGTCRLISRKQIIYKTFTALSTALATLPVENAILDGELVCLGADGRSQFIDLLRKRRQDAIFYAFDLLWHDGEDLRPLPLVERKRRLRRLVRGRDRLLFAEQIQGSGVELFQAICDRDLEGIVAKHRLGPYEPRPVTWFKVLNPNYSQKRGRREMFDKFRTRGEQKPPVLESAASDPAS
jgi:bifunctional non-homologous end joining protein LigD